MPGTAITVIYLDCERINARKAGIRRIAGACGGNTTTRTCIARSWKTRKGSIRATTCNGPCFRLAGVRVINGQ